MENPNLLQRIINAYSKKTNNWQIRYDQLLSFINNLVINDESGRYSVFSTNTSDVLTAMLISLENSGQCGLQYSGTLINKIQNYSYLNSVVNSAYQDMEANSEYPFPSVHSLGIIFPEDRVKSIHMPDNFVEALRTPKNDESVIYKLLLSSELSPVVAEGGIIRNRMLVLAVNKIRNYLAHKNNANYTYQKMAPICKKNTRALVDTIKMVQSNPGRAAMAIKKPDEFIFTFWTQLCSFMKKEFSGKENKTSHDEGMLQSALLINAYILHYKNIILNTKRKNEALKYMGDKLKKEPFYFSISDIYSFRDKNGPLLDKKYKKDDLHEYLNERLQVKNNDILPELIKVKTIKNKMFYIHRTVFLNLVHNKINDAHDYYRKYYLDKWTEAMHEFKVPAEMNNDELFHSSLEKNIKKEDPLLYAILGYELLFLAINDSKNIKLKAVAEGWIDTKLQVTKPLPVVLSLKRRDLVSEVRSIVPFWLTIGFFRRIAAIFGRNKKRKKKSIPAVNRGYDSVNNIPISTAVKTISSGSKSSGKNKNVEYKNSLNVLKKQFNYSSSTIHDKLDELSNQWNPLLDYDARKNLVKDVNNMVRDYMRKILRETSFAVPDRERVNNIVELLSGNKAFNVIKKRESFNSYLRLYIIKTLSETKP